MDSWKTGATPIPFSVNGGQKEVVAEAEKMIPDAKQRLEAGVTDLKALLVCIALVIKLICRRPQERKFQARNQRRLRRSLKKQS
jgi:hypothetical protein